MDQHSEAEDHLGQDNSALRQENQRLQQRVNGLEAQLEEVNSRLRNESKAGRQVERQYRILKKAIETMRLGVTITDINRKIIYTNPADARMHDYTPQELIGQDVGIYAPEKLRQRMSLDEIIEMKGWIRESINVRKNGSQFPVYLMSDLVRDDTGKAFATITTCEDISERKRAEEALSEERNLLRALIDNIPDYIYVKDRKGLFLLMNRAYATALKIKQPEEIAGKTVFDFFPDEVASRYTSMDRRVIEAGESLIEQEDLIEGPDGPLGTLLVTKIPLQNKQKKTIGLVGISRDISKRKKMENALRHSEQEKSLILDSMSEIVIYYDKDLNILWTNRAANQALGKSAKELVGQPAQTLWWHQKESREHAPVGKTLKTLTPQAGEFVSPQEEIWYIRAYPVFGGQNELLGLVEFAGNITIQKQAQARVEHLNAVLNAIRNVNQLIVREKNPKQLIQSACDRLVRARGYASAWIFLLDKSKQVVLTAEAGSDKSFRQLAQLMQRRTPPLFVTQALENPSQQIFEYSPQDTTNDSSGGASGPNKKIAVKISHEGKLYGLLFVALPRNILAAQEERTLLEEIAEDMAFALYNLEIEKRQEYAEKTIQENEQWLAATLKNLSEAVVTTNDRGAVTFFNPIAETLTGWKQYEILGKDVSFQVITQEVYASSQFSPADSLESTPQITIVLGEYTVIIAKDGTHIPIEYSGNPIIDDNGQFIGFVMVFKDITERQRMEMTLKEERASLAEKVEERTAELSSMNELLQGEILERQQTQIELEQAKEEAESASRAKSEFLANMSHELRTPLNAILGYAQIIKNATNLNERQLDGLDIIKNSGIHLLNLINEILDLSKIEAGHMELNPTSVDLSDFLKQIAEMIGIRAKQKGIEFLLELAPDLPVGVRVDEKRLRQILINLLGNAVKFTEQGSVTFRIRTETRKEGLTEENSERTVHFEIADTGIGIDQEQLAAIFLPFQQVGEKRHTVEGTGLGLTISNKLIHLMNSKLIVNSTLGQGTVFQFSLQIEELLEFSPTEKPQHRTILGYSGKRRTVLAVDDRSENRTLLRDMLSPLGFKIIEAENGQRCIEQSLKHHPDVTLLDLRMPVMNGIEAVEHIRQEPALRDQPIIALSASVYEDDRQRSLQAGCNDFLVKPLHLPELLDLLHTHLHLEWIYGESENTTPSAQELPLQASTSTITLPAEEREILLKFASSGRVKPLLSHLDTLDRQYQAVADELRQLAKTFQLPAIVEKLQSMGDSA